MTDYFATLGEPRRPWLEEDALKKRFLALTSEHHPDVAKTAALQGENAQGSGSSADFTGPAPDFALINLAYQTLREPRTRLRHLLELERTEHAEKSGSEGAPTASLPKHQPAPEAVGALFSKMGGMKHTSDTFLKKRSAATSPLAKALLMGEQLELQEKLEAWLAELEEEKERGMAVLPALDALWQESAEAENAAHAGQRSEVLVALGELAQLLGYLDKWIAQVREALVKLQIDF